MNSVSLAFIRRCVNVSFIFGERDSEIKAPPAIHWWLAWVLCRSSTKVTRVNLFDQPNEIIGRTKDPLSFENLRCACDKEGSPKAAHSAGLTPVGALSPRYLYKPQVRT